MTAKRCDRCRKFYDIYNTKCSETHANGFMYLNIQEDRKCFSHRAIDLCPSCMDALYKFMTAETEE